MKTKIENLINLLTKDHNTIITNFIKIIDDMGLKDDNKLSGLLYFALINNKITIEEIKENYEEGVFNTVSILNKLDTINYSQQMEEAENLRKMFFAITKDIRTIMLKIAFVVANLRNSENKTEEEKLTLANSIFALFAPLSARLGLSSYKTELEEGAFKIKEPKLQEKIQKDVDSRFHKRQPIVERLKTLVSNCLKELNIDGKVYGRKKHIYSIYKKLQEHESLDKIYDLIAVRAIVKTIPECYALVGRLHSIVEPYKNRFKDYITTPKPNGYQSLHTTVLFEGFPVEIQIRTEEMHHYAEYGVAAHWMYKEKRNKQDSLDVRLAWLREMMEDDSSSIDDLANSLNQDIYNSEIFVQTPAGKVVYLPSGSTPIDFAYSIHSAVGNQCVGAKVNNKMVPTTSELKNGDVVEIITNPNSKGPSRDWLKICKTASARNKINSFFKKNMKEETIKLGKSMMESAIKEKGYSVSKLTSSGLDDVLKSYNMAEVEELYANGETISYIAEKIKDVPMSERPVVHYVYAASNKGVTRTVGGGGIYDTWAEHSGAVLATKDYPVENERVSEEELLSINPDYIMIGGMSEHVVYEELMQNEAWSNADAIKNGRVYTMPIAVIPWDMYGVEYPLWILWTAQTLYPNLIDKDMVIETREFYKLFFDVELTDTQINYILNGLAPDGTKITK